MGLANQAAGDGGAGLPMLYLILVQDQSWIPKLPGTGICTTDL